MPAKAPHLPFKEYLALYILGFIALFLVNCEDNPTSLSEVNPSDSGFNVIVDSSFYRLTATHNSHIQENFLNSAIPYTPVFDLTVKLNEPSRRKKINKLIIYDDQEYGWEFTAENLENYFNTSDSTYYFYNLLFKPNYTLNDKLFFIRLIGEGNESSLDYNFIFKGEYPYFIYSTNYWTSTQSLETELFINQNNSSGYNPLINTDSVSFIWLNEEKDVSNIVPQIKDQLQVNDYGRYFYSKFETSIIPDEAMFSYVSLSEFKFNSEYRIITSIDPIISRLPSISEFLELNEYEQRIIYADNETAIFLTWDSENSNMYSTIHIFDLELETKIHELTIFGVYYRENNLVHYNSDQQTLYFFDKNADASSFNLETKQQSKIGFTTNNLYYNYVLPFGQKIIFFDGSSQYLYDINSNSGNGINFNFNFWDYNSYLYSDITDAIYMGDDRSEYFLEITTSDSINFTGEMNFQNNNLSTYSNANQKLHYSSSDSSLIHTSGAIISLKKSVSFSSDSALVNTPSISAFASGWIDDENLLIVLDYQSEQKIRVFKKINNSLTEYGYLEPFGNPIDIFVNGNDIKVSSLYYQGESQPSKTIIVSYSIDDIIGIDATKSFKPDFKQMKRIYFPD